MRKNQILSFFTLFMAVLLVSCKPTTIKVENKKTLNQTVYADQLQSNETVAFTTSGEWASVITSSTGSSWISIDPVSGDKEDSYTLTISLKANITGKDRSSTITIVCLGEVVNINVLQKATTKNGEVPSTILIENPDALNQDYYAEQEHGESITFRTIGAWESRFTPSDADSWISVSQHYGDTSGIYVLSIKIKPNVSGKDRSAIMTLSCEGEEKEINIKQLATTIEGKLYERTVYIAGYEINEKGIWVAKLWINGRAQNLTDGTKNASAFAVYASGKDVYVAGYERPENEKSVAILWKNGVAQRLSSNPRSGLARNIFISDDDVYVTVFEDDGHFGDPTCKLLKNGKAQNINLYTHNLPIYVSGNDVYLVGEKEVPGNKVVAFIWKNGVIRELSRDARHSGARSVFLSGSDVYVAGYIMPNPFEPFVATLWKNGVVRKLTNGAKNSGAVLVNELNNEIVVVINEDDVVKLWKNGKVQNITKTNVKSKAKDAFILDNDVYVVGYEGEYKQEIPKIWKNGVGHNLIFNGSKGEATSVFVK